jgi:hypothetical protein
MFRKLAFKYLGIKGYTQNEILSKHCFILNDTGHKMTYCPKSGLVSFNHNDFRYRYCHFCKEYMNRNYNSYQ